MRILGIGEWNDLGDMYLRLAADEHDVRVHIARPEARDILAGMITQVEDWRAELPWIRQAGAEGFIIFETATMGAIQDELRREGYQVIGGCAYGDRLEGDRAFGQQVLRDAGMMTIPSWTFAEQAGAMAFIRAHPGRYVLKYDGSSGAVCHTFAGRAQDGSDVLALMAAQKRGPSRRHLLMEYIEGVEVGVGAYFNGERFLAPACLDWEHKRFFPQDLGELTGEMGTLVTYEGSSALFERSLGRLAGGLRGSGYRGYINLNTIVDQRGVWPLELTSRFGYPGFAILSVLQPDGWADLLRRMSDPDSTAFATRPGYAVGVVITVPPFPYPYGYEQLGKGTAIAFTDITLQDQDHFHFSEVAQHEDGLCCSGVIGEVMTVTGWGASVEAARADAYARAGRVIVPNGRYRSDIGERFLARDRALLRGWGLMP